MFHLLGNFYQINLKKIQENILALNTDYDKKRAYSINLRGGYGYQLDFDFGSSISEDFHVSRSCSLQWKNQHYFFGGDNNWKRQVTMVNENRLELKGTLDFYFDNGGCTGRS